MAETGSSLQSPKPLEVASAGTAQRLPSLESDAAKSVIVQALASNEEPIVVGASTVKAKAGAHGSTELQGIELAAKQTISFDVNDPAQIWVDVRKAKDGVSYVVLVA
jgi:hypothetical protein